MVIFDYHIVLTIAGVLVGMIGYALYFRSVFKGETKPHIFTWVVYTLNDGIVFVAQVVKGGGLGSSVLLFSVFANFAVALVAVRRGEKAITLSDWACLIASCIAILLWIITDDPLIAVIIAAVINVVGVLPTFRKAYLKPSEESITLWAWDVLRFILGFFALSSITLTTGLFPAVIVLTNATLVGMILLRRRDLGVDTR